jgi:hypothetical protein
MLDVNVLDDDDVLFTYCHSAYWTLNYSSNQTVGTGNNQPTYMLYRRHDELELNKGAHTVLLIQLGAGIFDH